MALKIIPNCITHVSIIFCRTEFLEKRLNCRASACWSSIYSTLDFIFQVFDVILHRMEYVYYANNGFLFNNTVDNKIVPDLIFVVTLKPKQRVGAE